MTKWLRIFLVISLLWPVSAFASDNVVNVYTWADEIPHEVIAQFEKETGIIVNYSTFDTNEIMYAKIRANRNIGYDLIEPSSFYIDRMRKQDMLEKLDKTQLANFKNLDPFFVNQAYDPDSKYSVPFIWGITGIFLNKDYFKSHDIAKWADLLDKKYADQLMFLDDSREVFSMAMLMLNYSINDANPEHIKQAYLKLKQLMPNVRLFNTDAVASILIDEDATIGMSWNGDLFRARTENSKLDFVYPKDGFEIWVDNFAIMKNAPHLKNAYTFLNFLMRPDIAAKVSLEINYSSANLAARKVMPLAIRNNPTLYPSVDVLKHGEFETDIDDKALALYEKYWELLKIGG